MVRRPIYASALIMIIEVLTPQALAQLWISIRDGSLPRGSAAAVIVWKVSRDTTIKDITYLPSHKLRIRLTIRPCGYGE